MQKLQAIRGFRDLYPRDKAVQNALFDTIRAVAAQYGFEEYDGPVVEPVSLYTDKSSRELLEKQTFKVVGQDEKDDLILRPEMTPTLARMVATKTGELIFPLRYFNIGQRFRYEAPQKGRSREFIQADFDILGSESVLADAEIISSAVSILLKLGAADDDFVVCINSRSYLRDKLSEIGIAAEDQPEVLRKIDRMDKSRQDVDPAIRELLNNPVKPTDNPYFRELFGALKSYGIARYCKIDLSVVRGLDYYTGMVFEVKDKGGSLRRSLFGGGRYDNLIAQYAVNTSIPGVGFAVSDVVLLEFLKEKKLTPEVRSKKTQVLVTVFEEDTEFDVIRTAFILRDNGIACELYPSATKKLDKQLKYADKNDIPFVIIAGPEEIQRRIVKLKNMATKEQCECTVEEAVEIITSYGRRS